MESRTKSSNCARNETLQNLPSQNLRFDTNGLFRLRNTVNHVENWPKIPSILLTQLGLGNWSNVKGVGAGVYERVIDFGPGYRIYFGKDGERLVILLAAGTKKRQQADINNAMTRWQDQDYKERKKLGE